MRIVAAGKTLELGTSEPLIMGIVNIGTDSVADELRLETVQQQLSRARALVHDGAAIIDIGVQSGRTDTPIIDAETEIEALVPLVAALAAEDVVVSVDIWRASVASAAIDAGAAIINDVSGLADEEMLDVVARSGAGLVLMHTRAAPKQRCFPTYDDPLADVKQMLEALIDRASAAGVASEQLIVDPGLDFAKSPKDSIEVLRGLSALQALKRPLLLAVSRKYFLGMITGKGPTQRLAATLAALAAGVDAGASVLRVHDVAEVRDYLAVRRVLRGRGEPSLRGDAHDDSLKWLPPKR